MTETVHVTATVDVDHVERQLLEAVDHPGFGPVASNALLAVRGLRAQLQSAEALLARGADELESDHKMVVDERGGQEDWDACRDKTCETCQLVDSMRAGDGERCNKERARSQALEKWMRDIVEEDLVRGQCRLCFELLDVEENDNGDDEILGHTMDCPTHDLEEPI